MNSEHSASPPAQAADSGGIQFRAPPFENTRDSDYFYASSGHAEALARMQYLVDDGNMGVGLLTGEIGCGKTMTRTVLHRRLLAGSKQVVSLENGLLDFDGLLLEILSQLRAERVTVHALPDRYSRLAAFKDELKRRIVDENSHLVILLDEAQQLERNVIEQLRGLTNIASERHNYLTLILIGQPELRSTIRALPQMDQRISLRYHLNPLSLEETAQYLRHRMTVAGLRGEYPIEPATERFIFDSSGGVPREINRLCKLALEHAGNLGRGTLTPDTVRSVVTDLRRHGEAAPPSAGPP